MQLPPRLTQRLTAAIAIATIATTSIAAVAQAGPAAGLCTSDTARGAVADDFAIDACVSADGIWLRNNLGVPIGIATTGDTQTPVTVEPDQRVATILTRLHHDDPYLLLPGDIMRVPVGTGSATATLDNTDAGGFHAIATTVTTFIPAGAPLAVYESFTGFISEVSAVYGQYQQCVAGKNFIGRAGCKAGFTWDIGYAASRAIALGAAKGIAAVLLDTASFLSWANAQPGDIGTILNGERTISIARSPSPSTTTLAPAPTRPTTTAAVSPSGPLGYTLSESPFVCDGGLRWFGTITGARPGETIRFSEATLGNLASGAADSNGDRRIRWDCTPQEAGTTWRLTATADSGRAVTFSFAGATPSNTPSTATPPSPSPTTTIAPAPPPSGGLQIELWENPFLCDGATRQMGRVTGAASGERLTFNAPRLGELLPGTASSSSTLTIQWVCTRGAADGTFTVDVRGAASGRTSQFTVNETNPAPQTTTTTTSAQASTRTITVNNTILWGAGDYVVDDVDVPIVPSSNLWRIRDAIATAKHGQQLTATCWTRGVRITDGNDSASFDDPWQYSSTLMYGVPVAGGRTGFVHSAWTTKQDDTLGLSRC